MFNDSTYPAFRKVFVAAVFGLCVFLVPNGVQSAMNNSATLQWAANQEPDLAGYRIYDGTAPGIYGSSQNVGMTTTYQYTNLAPNTTYYFSVTAYDTSGNESLPSQEVFKTILSTSYPDPTPAPSPEFPVLVNFQPSSSAVPSNYIKDDGSVFHSSRGYGWDSLVNGKERNANVDQTLDTFVQTRNTTPVTWNYTLPNGTYYLSMVMGDPRKKQGPHWMSVEGMRLAAQIKTREGEYFSIVEYPVNIQDNTLSITLGGEKKGTTLLNFLIIHSAPNLSQTMQALTQSFGTDLLAAIDNPGTVAKVNPKRLVKQENHRQGVLAKIQRFLAKIERKLVKYADKPKKVARLNKHKERLLTKLDKIQESSQSMN